MDVNRQKLYKLPINAATAAATTMTTTTKGGDINNNIGRTGVGGANQTTATTTTNTIPTSSSSSAVTLPVLSSSSSKQQQQPTNASSSSNAYPTNPLLPPPRFGAQSSGTLPIISSSSSSNYQFTANNNSNTNVSTSSVVKPSDLKITLTSSHSSSNVAAATTPRLPSAESDSRILKSNHRDSEAKLNEAAETVATELGHNNNNANIDSNNDDDIRLALKTNKKFSNKSDQDLVTAGVNNGSGEKGASDDGDLKNVRKSSGKSLFKNLFCCFASAHRSRKRNYKNGVISNATSPSLTLSNDNFNSALSNSNEASSIINSLDANSGAAGTGGVGAGLKVSNENESNSNNNNKQKNDIYSASVVVNDNLTRLNLNNSSSTPSSSPNAANAATTTVSTANANLISANALNNVIASVNNIYNQVTTNSNSNNNSSSNNNNNNNNNNNTTNTSFIGQSYYSNDHTSPHFINEKNLLPPVRPSDSGKKCLIIDLDETLVHSSFKQVHNADFIVPVEIDGQIHQVYVLKRPYVDEFLKKMGELYECVLFTASLAKYADPVADLLDKWGVFRSRLFREACVYYRGNYVKDLSRLGRDLNKVIILDNSPASYIFHPDNAIACTSWFDDMHDTELHDLIPYFESLASVDSVYSILKQSNDHHHHQQSYNYHHGGSLPPTSMMQQQPPSTPLKPNQQHHNLIHLQNQTANIYIQQQQQQPYQNHNRHSHPASLSSSSSSAQAKSSDAAAAAGSGGEDNQQVPSSVQSIIFQQQQSNTSIDAKSNAAINNLNYLLSENKILLSIDLMMARKQDQLNQQQQQQQQQ